MQMLLDERRLRLRAQCFKHATLQHPHLEVPGYSLVAIAHPSGIVLAQRLLYRSY